MFQLLLTALALKNIDYEYRSIHIAPGKDEQLSDKFLAIHQNGQVPVLVVHENGQQHALSQSISIIRYLEDKYPQEPKLLPSDPLARYHVNEIVDTIASGIQPLQNLPILKMLEDQEKGGGAQWARKVIEKGFVFIEAKLKQVSTGNFCVGDHITLADLCLVPQVYNAHRYGVDMSKFPRISAVAESLGQEKAIAASHPSKQPDAEG